MSSTLILCLILANIVFAIIVAMIMASFGDRKRMILGIIPGVNVVIIFGTLLLIVCYLVDGFYDYIYNQFNPNS